MFLRNIENLAGRIQYVQFLHDESEILYQKIPESSTVQFLLSVVRPDSIVPVIVEIMLKEKNRGGYPLFF